MLKFLPSSSPVFILVGSGSGQNIPDPQPCLLHIIYFQDTQKKKTFRVFQQEYAPLVPGFRSRGPFADSLVPVRGFLVSWFRPVVSWFRSLGSLPGSVPGFRSSISPEVLPFPKIWILVTVLNTVYTYPFKILNAVNVIEDIFQWLRKWRSFFHNITSGLKMLRIIASLSNWKSFWNFLIAILAQN